MLQKMGDPDWKSGVANNALPVEPQCVRAKFRVAEKLAVLFFTLELAGSMLFPLPIEGQLKIWGLSFLGVGVLLIIKDSSAVQQGKVLSALRDWYPCLLIPIAYRASGVFFTADPRHRLDQIFVEWDNALLGNAVISHWLSVSSPWLGPALEISYLLCYPLVPLALLTLVLARRWGRLRVSAGSSARDPIDYFWTAVLLAVLSCYVLYPFFPLTPPRVLYPGSSGLVTHSALRALNLWLLHQNGDQASLFPSGHVAGVVAASLAVRVYLPRMGWVFLATAASVTIATIVGRYHYAADAVAGVIVAVGAFAIANSIFKQR